MTISPKERADRDNKVDLEDVKGYGGCTALCVIGWFIASLLFVLRVLP